MKRRLLSLLNIEPEEAGAVSALTFHSFFLGLGMVSFFTAAYALFLSEFDAGRLPFVYIGVAVVVPVFGLSLSRIGERASFRLGQVLNTGSVCALLAALAGIIHFQRPAWALFFLPVASELLLAAYSLGFWPLASRLFDVRQGKRLFPLLGLGVRLGQIAGGLVIPAVIGDVGTVGLLWASAGAFLIALLTLVVILHRRRSELESESGGGESAAAAKVSFKRLLRSRYILLLILFAAIPSVAYNLFDYAFLESVELREVTEQKIATFMAYFRSAMNIGIAFCMLFVGGRLMSRFGLRLGIYIKPVILLALVAATLGLLQAEAPFEVLFWLVVAMKLLDVLLRFVFEVPSIHVLKLPLGKTELQKTNTLVESVVRPLMNGLGGVLLLVLTGTFDRVGIPILVALLALMLLWTLSSLSIVKEYRIALLSALRRRKVGEARLSIDDAHTVEIIRLKLESPHPAEVAYAIELLDRGGHEPLAPDLERLLHHGDADVRLAALAVIERRNITSLSGAIRRLAEKGAAAKVRAEAVRVLGVLGDTDLGPWVDDDDLGVRVEAIAALFRRGDIEPVIQGLDRLRESPDPEWRAAAAQIVAKIGSERFRSVVEDMVEDDDPEVRTQVLVAIGQAPVPELWPILIEHLGQRPHGQAAVDGLGSAGEPAVPLLTPVFGPSSAGLSATIDAVRACARIRGGAAIHLLLEKLGYPSGEVRASVHSALRVCGFGAEAEQRELVTKRIQAEAFEAVQAIRMLQAFDGEPALSQLHASLADSVGRSRERIYDLLAFLFDRETIERAVASLRADVSTERRAIALELLETTLTEKAKVLLPFFAAGTPDRASLGKLAELFPAEEKGRDEWLVELARDTHAVWLRALAIKACADLGVDADLGELEEGAPPVVREAAAYAREGGRTMLPLIERVIFLKTIPTFGKMSDELLLEVAPLLEEVRFETGENLFEAGEIGRALFLIVDGRVRTTFNGEVLADLERGESIGDLAVFARKRYPVTTTALEPTLTLRLEGQVFRDLVAQYGEMALGLIERLTNVVEILIKKLGHGPLLPEVDDWAGSSEG